MPMKCHQLSALPQAQDEPQSRLEQAQGGAAHIIDELLLAGGNDMRAPQQQPGVDQRQGQQQPLQTVGMAHAGQFQAKATPVIFKIFEHLFNPKPPLVTATGLLARGCRRNQIPRFSGRGRPVHRQIEAGHGMFLGEGDVRPEAALAGQHQGQPLKIRGAGAADILVGPQAQADAPTLVQRPLRQHAGAKLPIPQQEHVCSAGHPRCHDGQQRLLLGKTRRPRPQPTPQQGQGPPAPPHADIQDVKGSPLRAVYSQVNPGAAAGQPLQDAPRQRLIVELHGHLGVLQKPLHALFQSVAGTGQGQRRQDLAHLQTLAAQDAQRYGGQIHHPGKRLPRQIAVQLGNQVGKHVVLWFDHERLRDRGCSLCGYNRSQPRPRRLFPSAYYRFFYCPLVSVLLSVCIDPRHDTPEVLKEYAQRYSANQTGWKFLVGNTRETIMTASAFGADYEANQDGIVDHRLVTCIIDREGIVVKEFSGTNYTVDEVLVEVETQSR